MSAVRLIGILFFSASLYAQHSAVPGIAANRAPADPMAVSSRFSPLLTASGDVSVGDQLDFDFGNVPDPVYFALTPARAPIAGVVSLRDLEHPVSKKALREAYAAQKFARANNLPQAIASLEKAVRIDPNYRDAHLNLGVQYARIGRLGDARAEFQKALDIGPPAAPVLVNLALIALATNQIHEAEKFGRQALELDPANTGARKILQSAAGH